MATTGSRLPIAVALPDSDDESLLEFAIQEAVLSGRDVVLYRVLRLAGYYADNYWAAHDEGKESGNTILSRAVIRAGRLAAGRVNVATQLVDGHGSVVKQLSQATQDAGLLVLQHRHMTKLQRVFQESVTMGVAGRSIVPLVSVGDTWRPPDNPYGVVAVGLDKAETASALLVAAAKEAQARDARLLVMHAGSRDLDSRAAKVTVHRRQDPIDTLKSRLITLEADFPELSVQLRETHEDAVPALLAIASESDLMVLGGRGGGCLGHQIGHVDRVTIRNSTCPVMLVNSPQREPSPV